MNLYGSLKRLVTVAFRKDANDVVLQPSQTTTYTATRTFSLAPGDTDHELVSATSSQTLSNKSISGSSNTLTNISLTTAVTGTLPIANGGTNGTTAQSGFDNLSPLSTKGDLVVHTGTHNVAEPVGTNGQVLTADSSQTTGVRWATPTTGTVTSVDVSGGTTGLTTSGGPITSSGTITLSGTLNIANGGTGQTTASAAFAALSPLTTAGDLIYENNTPAPARLPIGTSGQVLTVSAGLPAWVTPTASSFNSDWNQLSHTVTISNASPGVVTWTGHGLVAGQGLYLTTTGTLPNPLTPNTIYYVVSPATNTFELALTPGGSAINTTTAGSGTHTANVTSINVVHNLGTLDVMVQLYDKTDGSTVGMDSVLRTDTNDVLVNASEIPSSAGWRVMILRA